VKATLEPQLGKALATFPKGTVYERGLVAQQWGREITIPWESLVSIYFSAAQDTIALLSIPIAQISERKLTLTAEDGTKVVLRGSSAEETYGYAVAATQEQRLARALDQLAAGKTVPFGPLLVSREALNGSGFARAIGLFPTILWSTVAGVNLSEGWVQLSRRNPKQPDAGPGASKPIARSWGVDNADVFVLVANSLADLSVTLLKNSCPGCGNATFTLARICRHCWRRVSRDEFLGQLPPPVQDEYRRRAAMFPAAAVSPPDESARSLGEHPQTSSTAQATSASAAEAGSATEAQHSGSQSGQSAPLPEMEWPRRCVIERPCQNRDEAVAFGRRLGKYKSVIESVRVSARADGVVLKVATRSIPQDVYRSIRECLAE